MTVDDHCLPPVAEPVFEYWNLDGNGALIFLHTTANDAEDMWMCHPLELPELLPVSEDEVAKSSSVDFAALHDFGPPLGHFVERRATRFEHCVADRVSVHREKVSVIQQLPNGALAAANPSADHPSSVTIRHTSDSSLRT